MNTLRNRLAGNLVLRRPVATPTVVSLILTALLLGLLLLLPDRAEQRHANAAQTSSFIIRPAAPGRTISLRDRLITGLQARLDSEVALIDDVVDQVAEGKLPQRLVDETFFWARARAAVRTKYWRLRRPRRPIIYFQPAIIARAHLVGVEL